METQPKSNRMFAIVVLYDMQSTYFNNVLDGIADADAHKRLDTKANHIAWLAGSMLEGRFELANWFGLDQKAQSHELFKHNKGIQDDVQYPSLESYKKDWAQISPILREKLMQASDAELGKILDFPEMNMSFPLYDMVTFNTYREANCIGQIALWRRLLNYPAMKYM
ncbi:DinB family protein [Pedobacter sp. KR3-3]|uniref:DinB family protein n=1 Tax=Pedobacter albus TaxID=3113905 RepID=A0ABU7I5L8_9SPHI|nr:DinB family protein [Pedobacter sp. KR3-3]MEE1944761.1 DinB family protein [Pedobacter sp. KR3-3]